MVEKLKRHTSDRDDMGGSRKQPPPKKLKMNGKSDVVGLADLTPQIVAIIASFGDSFYEQSKLREVSKLFNQGVLQCTEYHITKKDQSMGHHVAALRHVCRVAEGKTITLDHGDYNLEGKFKYSNEYESDDDVCEYDVDIEGLRFDIDRFEMWKPNKGPLIIKAEGITLRCMNVSSYPVTRTDRTTVRMSS